MKIPKHLFLSLIIPIVFIFTFRFSTQSVFAGDFTLPIVGYNISSWFDHTSPWNPGAGDIDCCDTMTRHDGFTGQSYNGHNGLDYSTGTEGKNVIAAAGGTITHMGWENPNNHSQGFGYYIRIRHDSLGKSSAYGHLQDIVVPGIELGSTVLRGDLIGYSGCTGMCWGPHLHFSVYNSLTGWRAIDPYGWSGSGSDPWTYNQGYLWTTNPPSTTPPFTNDNYTDLTTFYDYGNCNTTIHTFLSTGGLFSYQGDVGWWSGSNGGYCANSIAKTASGDFDNDGIGDIAAFYDYGAGETRIHVFKGDPVNRRFNYQGDLGWWRGTAFSAAGIKYAAAGNFNSDSYTDIVVAYDQGGGHTTHFVFISNGSSFTPYTWWDSWGYWLPSTYGAAADDFNGDGLADLSIFYDYGSSETRIHTFLSNGSSFPTYQTWWTGTAFTASAVKHVNNGRFSAVASRGSLTAFYDYGGGSAGIFMFESSGSSFTPYTWWSATGYWLSSVPFVLSGAFDSTYPTFDHDLSVIYAYPLGETRIHEFLSTGSSFPQSYQTWWSSTGYTTSSIKKTVSNRFGNP